MPKNSTVNADSFRAQEAPRKSVTPKGSAAVDTSCGLEQLVSGSFSKLCRTALRYLDNPEDAKEAVQDALLSAFRHGSQFQHRSKFSTWLNRIVINSALMKRRSGRKYNKYQTISLDENTGDDSLPLADQLFVSGPNPEQLFERAEFDETLTQVIARLPPIQRRVYELCARDGWSTREASRILGIGESALKCRPLRARRTLRGPLQQRLRPTRCRSENGSLRHGRLRPSRAA